MPFYHFRRCIAGKLRYRSNDRYPFVAIAHLDENLQIVNSYTGWIFTEEKLQRKLQVGAGNE